jgi:magnesium transporter
VQLFRKTSIKPATSPGTIEFIGERKAGPIKLQVMDYDLTHFEERELSSAEETFPYKLSPRPSWINIDGLHDTETVRKIGTEYEIHPLVLEDIVHTRQRPKLVDYDDYIYLVFKMLSFDEQSSRITSEQVSIILRKNAVLSFQETQGDVFDPVRERIRSGKGRIRGMGPDYLAYALLDAVVDNYYLVLEKLGERIEAIEDELMQEPARGILWTIHELKQEVILLRRSVWPLREVLNSMQRDPSKLIRKNTGVYLRDVYDHTIQIVDVVESFRDVLAGLQDLYLSSVSNRMNEVIKVLTVIATIFVPLTFLTGIYGMNFDFMPELKWKWGYLGFWGVNVVATIWMLAFFRRRRWL